MPDDGMTIQFEGKYFAIDDFELGELEWLEEELDCTLDEINPSSMKAAVRFVYLIKRRENPDFTLEDARKLKLQVFADEDQEPDPPTRPAATKPAGKQSAKTRKASG